MLKTNQIYHADCLEFLEQVQDRTVHLAVIDPPYNMRKADWDTFASEKEFFDFVYERQLIGYKRFKMNQNFPWSKNPILQKYKILNVYRELDKGTIYVIEKLKRIKDRKIIFLNVVFYRFFNKYNLYEYFGVDLFNSEDSQIEQIKEIL